MFHHDLALTPCTRYIPQNHNTRLTRPLSEYDVPYYIRASIDMGVRVGHWYKCEAAPGEISLKYAHDLTYEA